MILSKEIRVVQLIDSLEPGGAERMAVNLANALVNSVAFSGLVTTRLEGQLKNAIVADVNYLFLKRSRVVDFAALFRLRRYVRKNKITIIHAHGSSFFFAVLLKMLLPSLHVFWHDHFGNRSSNANSFFLLRFCSFFFKGVFTVNESLKIWAEQKLFCSQVKFIPNFSVSDPSPVGKTFLKGEPHKKIVFLANLHQPKNHILALKAFLESEIASKGWTLHLVGKDKEDAYSKELKIFIQEHAMQSHIYIHGSCDDVSFVLQQAKIGILVSSYEAFPLSLLEYGLAGLAVICSDVGYCSAIIENDFSGRLIPPNDEMALKEAFIAISNQPEKNEIMAKNLNTFVQSTFTPEAVMPKICFSYQKSI